MTADFKIEAMVLRRSLKFDNFSKESRLQRPLQSAFS
jgi:hypothetical protein